MQRVASLTKVWWLHEDYRGGTFWVAGSLCASWQQVCVKKKILLLANGVHDLCGNHHRDRRRLIWYRRVCKMLLMPKICVGGIVRVRCYNLPLGLGEPFLILQNLWLLMQCFRH
jgi:hypothetical protein